MSPRWIPPRHTNTDAEPAFSVDRYGNWSAIEAAWASLTGWAPEQMVGKPLSDFVHEADRGPVLEALQSLVRGEIYSCRVPARFLRRDGMHCWVEVVAYPTLDHQGRIDGAHGTVADITDRRKGMRALRESEARFRAISDASPLGVLVTDASMLCIFANRNYEKLTGLRPDQLRGDGYLRSVHDADRARLEQAAQAARQSLLPYRVEHRNVHPDGSEAWSRVHAAPILDGASFLGFVHVVEDITTERSADAALRRSQERLQLALDGSGVALIDWDVHSGELYLSEQWGRITGGAQAAAVTTINGLLAHIHPLDQQELERAVDATLRGAVPLLRAQCRVRTQAGDWKWIEVQARVMDRDGEARPMRVAGTCSDITDRKQLEARQAGFMASVSHELRTPLASVLGALEILRDDFRDSIPEPAGKFLDMALRNGNQLSSLINTVLDLERIETGVHGFKFETIAVNELLMRAVEVNQPFALRLHVTLHADTPPEVSVWTDPMRALQVLTNVISNAVKFSPEGAAVTLGCEVRGEHARVFVEDHGPGIPEDAHERIFRRFGQASNQEHSRSPGSGLGLSICKALLARMGGDIGFQSQVGRGSRFWIDLPRFEQSGRAGNDSSPA